MKKRILPCFLIVSMMICLMAPAAMAATDAWKEKDVAYGDIEDMVDDCVNFTDTVGTLQQSLGTLTAYAEGLKTQLGGLSETDPSYPSLKAQLDLTNASILQLKVSIGTIEQAMGGKDSAREQTIIAAETLFITYSSLRDQANAMSRQQGVFNTNLSALEKQHSAGYLSDLQLEKAKAQSGSLQTAIQTMQSQLTAVKRSFNTLLGRDYNQSLSLHALPFSELDDIGDIKFRSDLDDALSNYGGDLSGAGFENPDYNEEKGSFAASVRKLYDAVNDKNSQLSAEQAVLAAEQKSYDASKKQYDSGLISQLALNGAQDSLDAETAKVKAAKTALFSAYAQYRWAIDYGIVSGS
ncbi:hypothetical protein [Caproiciproducens sp.]